MTTADALTTAEAPRAATGATEATAKVTAISTTTTIALPTARRAGASADPETSGKPSPIVLPGALALQAALIDRVRAWRTISMGLMVALMALIGVHYAIVKDKLFTEATKDWIIVPGVTAVQKVRAGHIPWMTVAQNADFFVNLFTNLRYDLVETSYQTLERYMPPDIANEFRSSWLANLQKWRKTQYYQSFHFEPTTTVYLVEGLYRVLVKGTLSERSLSQLTGLQEISPDRTGFVEVHMEPRMTFEASTSAVLDLKSIRWITERDYVTKSSEYRKFARRGAAEQL